MKLLILSLMLSAIACVPPTIPPNTPATVLQNNVIAVESAYTGNGVNYLYIYTIDSCEYIGTSSLSSNYAFLTHKGNCKYCLNRK